MTGALLQRPVREDVSARLEMSMEEIFELPDDLFFYTVRSKLSATGLTELQEGRFYHEMLKRINPDTQRPWTAKDAAEALHVGYGTFRNREALWHPYDARSGKGLSNGERRLIAQGRMTPSFASKKSMGHFRIGDGFRKTKRRRAMSRKQIEALFDATSAADEARRKALAEVLMIPLTQAIVESMDRIELSLERAAHRPSRRPNKAA